MAQNVVIKNRDGTDLDGTRFDGKKAINVDVGISMPSPDSYDYGEVSYPSGTREVYVFKDGGSGGVVIATLTIDYTDSSKQSMSSWEWS